MANTYIETTGNISVNQGRVVLNNTLRTLLTNFSRTSAPTSANFTSEGQTFDIPDGTFYHDTNNGFYVYDANNNVNQPSGGNWKKLGTPRSENGLAALRANVRNYEIGELVSTVSSDSSLSGAADLYVIKDNARNNASIVRVGGTGVIGSRAVNESHLADSSVISRTIASGAVTNAKLADDSVDTSELASSAVTENKIKNGAVDDEHVSTGISGSKITDNTLDNTRIADNTININKLNITGTAESGQLLASSGNGNLKWVNKPAAASLDIIKNNHTIGNNLSQYSVNVDFSRHIGHFDEPDGFVIRKLFKIVFTDIGMTQNSSDGINLDFNAREEISSVLNGSTIIDSGSPAFLDPGLILNITKSSQLASGELIIQGNPVERSGIRVDYSWVITGSMIIKEGNTSVDQLIAGRIVGQLVSERTNYRPEMFRLTVSNASNGNRLKNGGKIAIYEEGDA